MTTRHSRLRGYLLYLLWVGLVIVGAFLLLFQRYLGATTLEELLGAVFVFDRFVVDFLLVALVGIWLVNLPGALRWLGYLWFMLFVIAYSLQFLSVYVGGEFVSFLAVDNINHVDLLLDMRALVPLGLVLAATGGLVWQIEVVSPQRNRWRTLLAVSVVLLLTGVVIQNNDKWLPAGAVAHRDGFYLDKDNYVVHKSPLKSLYRVLFTERPTGARALTRQDLDRARGYGIHMAMNEKYPLVRESIYSRPLPFENVGNSDRMPNVIVFFTEGIAARTVNAYSDRFEGLTPNIADFSRYAMRVDNYYNHTFATYRGLHGQLCSIFPTYGGIGGWHTDYASLKNVSYYCLPHALNEVGYRTIFLDTHRADAAFVDEMTAQLGFDLVVTAEFISEFHLDREEPRRKDALSDNQLMRGLVGMLRALEREEDDRPFFLGLYNLQTHAWQKITADGVPYRDGSSHVLDTIHNYDAAFGDFWEFFRNSTLARDTVVIFTADHTHYPEREFVRVIGDDPDYTPVFVDRIPLLIYDPRKRLPRRYDADYATSIDFAPTLVHWLGLENRPHPFIGRSLFDERPEGTTGQGIAGGGDEIFLVNRHGVHKKGHDSAGEPAREEELEFIETLLRTVWQLEQHNRIWPGAEG